MPIYEYYCQVCGKNSDVLHPTFGNSRATCPNCGAKADRKVSQFTWKWGRRTV